MAAVGGMLASAVIKVVIQQLGSVIGGKIVLQQNFSKDLEKTKMTLESVEAVLKDAERRSMNDAAVGLWLERLKNAMYDISDIIDGFEANTKPAARKLPLMTHCLTIIPKIFMANKMKKMREQLKEITDQHHSFSFKEDSCSNVQQVTDIRETSSTVEEALIIGRTEDKQKMMDCLFGSITQEITILPIYGIGGIGKTTLAKLVFNYTQFKDYSRVWVYVSQTFDLNKIGNCIISQVSEEQSQMTERQMIHNRLGKVLASKEILIVLDDLWEKGASQLQDLKAMLKLGEGSKVIVLVTTRDEDIAREICTVEPYKLAPLKDDTCWDIIKQKSNFEARDDNGRLEQIGREIAMKCGGVALAAQSLGYMLKSKMIDEWESVRNSDIWNLSTSEHTSSLFLSYSRMPPYLKLCFAYCAIFPKGHNIVKDDLIHQWIALGIIEPSGIFSTKQLSENYVRQLLGMSFLQYAKSPSTHGQHDKDATLFTMHDLVHDLARSVMADEVLDASTKLNSAGSSCRYALLTDCSKLLHLSMISPAKIRALRFLDRGKIILSGAAFSSSKYLRVLDLSECSIQKLPDSICQLKQLRYLNAPRIQDRLIPNGITKLSKLIYLNLRGSCNISELPESISEMEGLMHLDLSGCLGIVELPVSFTELKELLHLDLSHCSRIKGIAQALGNLTKLQYLNLSGCFGTDDLPVSFVELRELVHLDLSRSRHVKGISEGFGGLTKLQYLNLSGCSGIVELPISFTELKELVHLDLSYCHLAKGISEALGCFSKLHYLNLSHLQDGDEQHLRGLPEVIGNLIDLRYLNLSRCMNVMAPSTCQIDGFIDRISSLSNLEHLDLSWNNNFVNIPHSIGSLKKLCTLDLSFCFKLRRLPENMAKMDSLKVLNVKGCYCLDEPMLSRLSLFGLLPHFVVHAGDGESSSNVVLLQHANPDELKISRIENVKSIKEVKSIQLMEKQRIGELTLGWTRDVERFVDDIEVLGELVPPSTLHYFVIRGYSSASFPAWLMGITDYVPNLVKIEMCDLPKCNSLPPLGQLPSLRELILNGMESLEEWDMTYSCGEDGATELMFPKLERLTICDCPVLRMKPRPPRAVSWHISNSDNVLSSWGESMSHNGASSSSPTTSLEVKFYKVPLHQWRLLHHLPALTALTITYGSDLTGSPEIIQHLLSLKSLSLGDNDQAEVPKWLGELTSLQQLEIKQYQLKDLHENMRQLTQLQSLRLSSCRSMTSLPQWLGEFISLKKLEIWNCMAIRSLPEGIQQLTNLQELKFSSCPELEQWCESKENKMKLAHIKQKSFR